MLPPRPHPPTPSPIAPPSPGRGGATARKRLNLNVPRGFAGVPPLPAGGGRWERGPGGEVYGAGSTTQAWSDALLACPLQPDLEHPPRAQPGFHVNAQERAERGDQRQAEACVAGFGARRVFAPEAVEDPGEIVRFQRVCGIADRQEESAARGAGGTADLAAGGAVGDGVREDVDQDPVELLAIGRHQELRRISRTREIPRAAAFSSIFP